MKIIRGNKTDGEVCPGHAFFETFGVSSPTKHEDQRVIDRKLLSTSL